MFVRRSGVFVHVTFLLFAFFSLSRSIFVRVGKNRKNSFSIYILTFEVGKGRTVHMHNVYTKPMIAIADENSTNFTHSILVVSIS